MRKTRRALWAMMLALLMLCLPLAAQASARETGVALENQLGYDLYELYISPTEDTSWGDDILAGFLLDGETIDILLSDITPELGSGMLFDILAMDEDGDYYSFFEVQINDGESLTLYFNDDFQPTVEVRTRLGRTRSTVGALEFGESEAQNYFSGYWIEDGYPETLFIFGEDDLLWVLDMEDEGEVLFSGSYYYSGNEGIVNLDGLEAAEAPEIYITYTDDGEILMDLEGEEYLLVPLLEEELEVIYGSDPGDGEALNPDRVYALQEDGSMRFRDYGKGLYVNYPVEIYVYEDAIDNALVVGDGNDGYALARDVTDAYMEYPGSDDDFMAQYIEDYAFGDYDLLYESLDMDYIDFEILQEGGSKRVATGAINIYSRNYDIQLYCTMSRCSYSDGEVRIIAKTVFAQFEDGDQLNYLRSQVSFGGTRR